MYCHKCGKSEQNSDAFCRSCGNYLPDVDSLVRKYSEEISPKTSINKNISANIFTVLFSIFIIFSIAFTFAGAGFSVIFVHISVLLSLMIGGWQLWNLRNNLKLKKLVKEKKLILESEKHYERLSNGNFHGLTTSDYFTQEISGSLQLSKNRLD